MSFWDNPLLDDKIIENFIQEGEDLINVLEKKFLELEDDIENKTLINNIFRYIHTLKGNAAAINIKSIKKVAHSMETLLEDIRKDEILPSTEMIDIFLDSIDIFKQVLLKLRNHDEDPEVEFDGMVSKLKSLYEIKTGPPVKNQEKIIKHDAASQEEVIEPESNNTDEKIIKSAWDFNLVESEMLEIFIEEASGIVISLGKSLIEIENNSDDKEILNNILIDIQSLKGNSGILGLQGMNIVAVRMEQVIDFVRKGHMRITTEIIDALLETTDIIKKIIEKLQKRESPDVDTDEILKHLDRLNPEIKENQNKETGISHQNVIKSGKTEIAEKKEIKRDAENPASLDKEDKKNNIELKNIDIMPWDRAATEEDMLGIFIEEAEEMMDSLGNCLIELENTPENEDLLNSIFRDMHSLKGNSSIIDLQVMNIVAHKAENILDNIRKKQLDLTTDIIDVMLECSDIFKEIIDKLKNNDNPNININEIVYKLECIEKGKNIESSGRQVKETADASLKKESIKIKHVSETTSAESKEINSEFDKININDQTHKESVPAKKTKDKIMKKFETASLRVDIFKLDNVMNLVGEIVIYRIRISQKIYKLNDGIVLVKNITQILEGDVHSKYEDNCTIHIEDKINNYINNLVIDSEIYDLYRNEIDSLRSIADQIKKRQPEYIKSDILNEKTGVIAELQRIGKIFKELVSELETLVEHLSLITKELQEGIIQMRMVPIAQLFDKMPRLVRGLSKDLKKKVAIEIMGEDTEIDKTVIEKLSDPLMHLIRNSVDHGIELPDERLAAGKPETGKIILSAEHKGNQVIIEIKDDGKGIDEEAIKRKAISLGMIDEEKALTLQKNDILELIFLPGFSNAEKVTEISGRGVGMDVVLNNIKKLKGTVEIDTNVGIGSSIIIRLPLTLAIMHAQLIKISGQIFAIPISFIEEIISIKKRDIMQIGAKKVYNLRGKMISLVRMNDVLDMKTYTNSDRDSVQAIIMELSDKRIGFIIDSVIKQQEIVIKSLGNVLKNVKHISGATILGEGTVVLILDMLGIYSSSKKIIEDNKRIYFEDKSSKEIKTSILQNERLKNNTKKILVAEDSTTIRENICDILKRAGYEAVAAFDGIDALEKAQTRNFDLFTVDVVMPRLNGYELVKKLREMPQYSKTPILMLTSKNEKIDKLRGLDAGADEYIQKPFEENYLVKNIMKFLG